MANRNNFLSTSPIGYNQITNDSQFNLSLFSTVSIINNNNDDGPLNLDPITGLINFDAANQNIEVEQIDTSTFTDVPLVFVKKTNTITPDGGHNDYDNALLKVSQDMFSPYTNIAMTTLIPDNYVLVRNSAFPTGFQWQYIGDASIELDPTKDTYILYNNATDIGYLQYITNAQIDNFSIALNKLESSNSSPTLEFIYNSNGSFSQKQLVLADITDINVLVSALNTQSLVSLAQLEAYPGLRRFMASSSGVNTFDEIVFSDISNASFFLGMSQLLNTDGTSGQTIVTDGSGTLSWITPTTFTPNALVTALNSQTYIINANIDNNTISGTKITNNTLDLTKISKYPSNPGEFLLVDAGTFDITTRLIIFTDITDSSLLLQQVQAAVTYSANQYLRRNGANTDIEFHTITIQDLIPNPTTTTRDSVYTYDAVTNLQQWKTFNATQAYLTVSNTGRYLQTVGPGNQCLQGFDASGNITQVQFLANTYFQDNTINITRLLKPTASTSQDQLLVYKGGTTTNTWLTTTNSVIYFSNTGIMTFLALGSSGQVLTSNGATSAPSWAAAGGITGSNSLVTQNNSGVTTLVAYGTNAYFLTSTGTTSQPTWTQYLPITQLAAPVSSFTVDQFLIWKGSALQAQWLNPTARKVITTDSSGVINPIGGTNGLLAYNGTSDPFVLTGGANRFPIWTAGGVFASLSAGPYAIPIWNNAGNLTSYTFGTSRYLYLGYEALNGFTSSLLSNAITNNFSESLSPSNFSALRGIKQNGTLDNYVGIDVSYQSNTVSTATAAFVQDWTGGGILAFCIGTAGVGVNNMLYRTLNAPNVFNNVSGNNYTTRNYLNTLYGWNVPSDSTLKTAQDWGKESPADMLLQLSKIPIRKYNMKDQTMSQKAIYGYFADDLLQCDYLKNAIEVFHAPKTKNPDGSIADVQQVDGNEGKMFVDLNYVQSVAIASAVQLSVENIALKARVASLEASTVTLNTQIAALSLNMVKLKQAFPLLGLVI